MKGRCLLILFSVGPRQLDRSIRCKSGRDDFRAGAETGKTGYSRFLFVNLYFSGFQSFREVGIYEGCKRGQMCIKRPGTGRLLSSEPKGSHPEKKTIRKKW